MTNANVARGLIPYRHNSGSPYSGSANIYYVPASYGSNIFCGDPVIVVDNGADANGIPAVALATAGDSNYLTGAMIGIVAGGEPVIGVTRDLPTYHQASTAGYILVADDPDALFEIQEDGAMVQGAPGRNANLVAGSGSTIYGYSGWQLQSSSLNTSAARQLRIVRLLEEADNAVGTNAKWLVRINLQAINNLTGV